MGDASKDIVLRVGDILYDDTSTLAGGVLWQPPSCETPLQVERKRVRAITHV